jgi:putative chitinase
VQPGETLSIIAERYGVSVDALVAGNNLRDRNTVHVDQELIIPSPPSGDATPGAPAAAGPRRYTVVAGDTLGSIAQRHGVTISAILRANNLTDPDAIKIGQELIIPSP